MRIIVSAVVALMPLAALAVDTTGLPHAFDAGWQGHKTCKLLFEDASVRIGECEFPPGVGHEKHYHNPHFGYVLEGSIMRLVDADGEETVTNVTGGSWSTTTVTVHEGLNVGETTGRYLMVEPRR